MSVSKDGSKRGCCHPLRRRFASPLDDAVTSGLNDAATLAPAARDRERPVPAHEALRLLDGKQRPAARAGPAEAAFVLVIPDGEIVSES
jgi:hypothetical protein